MTSKLVPAEDALRVVPDSWLDVTFASTAWDPTLKPREHARLASARVLGANHAWACTDDADRLACCWLASCDWDTAFFGIKMAVLGLEGHVDDEALNTLLPMARAHAAKAGIQHVRTSQRAGAPRVLQGLQRHGFEVRWASVQIACDTRTLRDAVPTPPPGLRFVTATTEHLPELTSASRRVGPYNWPEFDPALPEEARQRYVAQRIENCISTPYASKAIVALWRERPVGLHASAILTHDPSLEVGAPFAYVRETFVAPDAPPRLGAHLIRAALHRLRENVRQVTGRVRLDGRAMLNTALGEGHRIVGDEILLNCTGF